MYQLFVFVSFFALGSARTLQPIKYFDTSPIIGGEEASIADAPWQVALLYDDYLRCGGSIIRTTVILTAGHCTIRTSAARWSVRAGSSRHGSGGTIYKVDKFNINLDYSAMTLDNDITVMFVTSPIFIDNINTMVIPMPTQDQDVAAGSSALVTGWGTTTVGGPIPDVLRKVTIPVVDQAACTTAYQSFGAITPRMICGGLMEEGGKGHCQGDSGGPFVVNGTIIGITSWGRSCGLPKYPAVFTRVPALVDWVETHIPSIIDP